MPQYIHTKPKHMASNSDGNDDSCTCHMPPRVVLGSIWKCCPKCEECGIDLCIVLDANGCITLIACSLAPIWRWEWMWATHVICNSLKVHQPIHSSPLTYTYHRIKIHLHWMSWANRGVQACPHHAKNHESLFACAGVWMVGGKNAANRWRHGCNTSFIHMSKNECQSTSTIWSNMNANQYEVA